MAVIKPSERKLAKLTTVHWVTTVTHCKGDLYHSEVKRSQNIIFLNFVNIVLKNTKVMPCDLGLGPTFMAAQ